ncbi:NYN domain-containing protein [Candidatus Bathyarchaeota archaeon]|nr:NYN domain-containing protein [Candidatus Bathyarchaeota archaeon]
MTAPRLAIFVDGANIDRASKDMGIRINYRRLKAFLAGNRVVVLANYYNSKSSELGELAFYSRLQILGYKLVLGPKKVQDHPQREVDVQIAVDMVSGAYTDLFDIALLASGDGDFAPAVRKLRSLNKSVEVASFRKQLSMSLTTTASRVIDLTSSIRQFKN